MKILYAVQATGNGHIARATQVLPYLQRYGKVDVFLSGANSQLQGDLPCRYRSAGVSLFYNSGGGLRYGKIARQLNPARLWKEIKALPVADYDLVINDFEPITALACALKKVKSVQFGHQASFQSKLVPRPEKKDLTGELLLRYYARASAYVGLHFEQYDRFIFEPVIKKEIRQAKPGDRGYVSVYLPAFSEAILYRMFSKMPSIRFEVFSKETKREHYADNIRFLPVHQQCFNESVIHAGGVITGAGFETPAEMLYLGKRLLCIPIRGQYEQYCNAAALERLGVEVIEAPGDDFANRIERWLSTAAPIRREYEQHISSVLQYLVENYPQQAIGLEELYPELQLC